MTRRRAAERRVRQPGHWSALIVATLSSDAAAQVVRLEILSREPAPAQAVGAAGPYEIVRGRVHGEVDPRDPHNRIIQDLDSRATQRARPGRVRGDVRAGQAGRSDEGVGRADLPGRQPRQRRRGAERRRRHLAGQRLAGRRRPDGGQSDDRRAGRAATPTARPSPARSSRASSTCPPARRRCRSV